MRYIWSTWTFNSNYKNSIFYIYTNLYIYLLNEQVTENYTCFKFVVYSCDHDRRAAIDPSVPIALAPGVGQAAIAVDNSGDSWRKF